MTDRTQSLPPFNGFYPTFLTKEWRQPTSSEVTCPDSYDGPEDSTNCLGDDLFELLKANPTVDLSQGDVVQKALDKTKQARGDNGQTIPIASSNGYYCLPPQAQGWRYTVFPAPTDEQKRNQCTVADCMVVALSSPDVTSVLYDDASKACMAKVCEGTDCGRLNCLDGCPAKTELQSSSGNCGEDPKADENTCNQNHNFCKLCENKGVQLVAWNCCQNCWPWPMHL